MRTALVGDLHVRARVSGRDRVAASRRGFSAIRDGERASRVGARRTRRRAPIHAMVIVHADTDDAPRRGLSRAAGALERSRRAASSRSPARLQRGYRPSTDREPFGFHDGIAQPAIRGLGPDAGVPTGEFILGYPNHYGCDPADARRASARSIRRTCCRSSRTPITSAKGWRDFGRHGSFVVYRKLQQDVAGILAVHARRSRARGSRARCGLHVWLASKCVGRWPSGAPLAHAPDADELGARQARRRSSTRGDPDGLGCPIGAHVRRANPRDELKPYPAEQSRAHVGGPSPAEARARLWPAALRCGAARAAVIAGRARSDRCRSKTTASGARHSFLLREREHPQPVRVRAADLVQQSALRRIDRQQRSDHRAITARTSVAEHMTIPQPTRASARRRCRGS